MKGCDYMIYITGDCHGNFRRFTKRQRMKLPFQFTENDYVIVCGDFGLCWADDAEFKYNCKWLSSLPFKILFVDGNHENFDMLNSYPAEEWNGGKIHHIVRDKIIHLMRGQVFTIEGKTFFTMGGASSHDVQGGILDKNDPRYTKLRRRAVKEELPYRVIGESWWKEELPLEEELQEGRNNLAQMGYQVDYIISHCASNRVQDELEMLYMGCSCYPKTYKPDILTDYFDELESILQYKQWICGHYHNDIHIDDRHTCLYERILPLTDEYENIEDKYSVKLLDVQ